MIYGLWQSAAGLDSQQIRQNLISSNLANSETPGFKPDWISLAERTPAVYDADTPGSPPLPHSLLDSLAGGLGYSSTHTDFTPGPLVATSNPLDLALEGDGFFTVRTPQGTRYTRDGRLTLSDDGTLVTSAGGFPLLDDGGQPIKIDRSQPGKILVDETGSVRQGEAKVGDLKITSFRDPHMLVKQGQNLFDGSAAKTMDDHSTVRQSAYEASAVDPIASMVRMIEASRAYQLNATMIQMQDETLSKAVNEVGRLA